MKRNNSMPPGETMDQHLPDIAKKENLIQAAHKMYDGKRMPGGLAKNVYEERKRSVLDIIEENVPPSREYERDHYLNPRSA